MLIGYMRVSTTDQSTDLQRDALIRAGGAERGGKTHTREPRPDRARAASWPPAPSSSRPQIGVTIDALTCAGTSGSLN